MRKQTAIALLLVATSLVAAATTNITEFGPPQVEYPCRTNYDRRKHELLEDEIPNGLKVAGAAFLAPIGLVALKKNDGPNPDVTLQSMGGLFLGAIGGVFVSSVYAGNRRESLHHATVMIIQLTRSSYLYSTEYENYVFEVEFKKLMYQRRAEFASLNYTRARLNYPPLDWNEFIEKFPIEDEARKKAIEFVNGDKTPFRIFHAKFFPKTDLAALRDVLEPLMTEEFLCANPKDPLDAHMIARKIKDLILRTDQ